jgi:alanyl-tRNA synthetase
VFYDCGAEFACGDSCQPGCRCGRFVEFSNTLFINYHLDEDSGVVRPLAEPFTELVIGAERVAMLLQRKPSVFEIDVIHPLAHHITALVGAPALATSDTRHYIAVIADHIRALLFLTADGAPPPGRGGRARLMRKLVRELLTAQIVLGISDDKNLRSLVRIAVDLDKGLNSQLAAASGRCLSYICEEQTRFEKTVRRGERRLNRILSGRDNQMLSGKEVLVLEKRYGVPVPLLELMLAKKRASYPRDEYQKAYTRWYRSVSSV